MNSPVTDQKIQWAVAIHGGAGDDPSRWDTATTMSRSEGLRRALQMGVDLLLGGAAAIDVVEAVIIVLENDTNFNAGRGAVLTDQGNAELDASIMNGRTAECGAVAGVTRVKNPITLARLVMTKTRHVLLVGQGADQFAVNEDVELVTPDYFMGSDSAAANSPKHFGTVGCVVRDRFADLAAGTSTGGTSKKLPGRVGDSPIIGAGTFAANDTCAVSGTGIGEEFIRAAVAYDVVAQMRYAGRTLDQAVSEIMDTKLRPGTGGLIAMSNDGRIVLRHNTPAMNCGWADSSGTFETAFSLL